MKKSYHFIGIGGIGMSAIAKLSLQKGFNVKGSDLNNSFILEKVKKNGATIQIGHKDEIVKEWDTIVVSTAIDVNNPEYKKAKNLNLKIVHRSDLLNEFTLDKLPILITGTHGKTTTSSLVAHVLSSLDLDPSFALGGILNSKNTNSNLGNGKYFVLEADESDGSFLKTKSFASIVTNLDKEHMSYWKNFDNLKNGFKKFYENANLENLFWCKDDKNLNELYKGGISYGFSKDADLK